jgi:hypothetical protein
MISSYDTKQYSEKTGQNEMAGRWENLEQPICRVRPCPSETYSLDLANPSNNSITHLSGVDDGEMSVEIDNVFGNEEIWNKKLEGVDKTPEGLFDGYAVISKVMGITRRRANRIWFRINKKDGFVQEEIRRYKFLDSLGRKKASVPVLTVSQIIKILPLLPGKKGNDNRDNQLQIVHRLIRGDRDLVKDVIHFADLAEKTLTLSTNTIFPIGYGDRQHTHTQSVNRHMQDYDNHKQNVFVHDVRTGEDYFLNATIEVDELWDIMPEIEEPSVPRHVTTPTAATVYSAWAMSRRTRRPVRMSSLPTRLRRGNGCSFLYTIKWAQASSAAYFTRRSGRG